MGVSDAKTAVKTAQIIQPYVAGIFLFKFHNLVHFLLIEHNIMSVLTINVRSGRQV